MLDLSDYPFTIDPFSHQRQHLEQNYKKKAWGLLWEQGTAKTKPIIDETCLLYANNEIDGLLVVAPPGVERNWNTDEIPKHMPSEFALDTMVGVFQTTQKHTVRHKKKMRDLMVHQGLAVLLISYDAFMTQEGKKVVWEFLKKRRCMYVLDEAHNIKSPGAKRTISINASAKYAPFRRILTGTPMAKGPFDLYSQIRFLDDHFWKNKGIDGSVAFRQFFGVWLTGAQHRELHGYDPGYDQFIEYQNLDLLQTWLTEISNRVLKDDVLDLPPKLYSKRYFDMSKEQRSAYEQLKKEQMLQIGDELVVAELPIVRLLRLQQIACNYIPVNDDEPVHMFSNKNPRLNVMEDIRDGISHPAIVWARFRHDVDQIMDLLGKRAVRYDGMVDEDQAEKNKLAFQRGDADWFVGTAQKGGPGLTLTQAKTMVYYSNSYRLVDRLQSEDRAHRAGMDEHPVDYIDIVANGTVDEPIIDNLRGKKEIIDQVLQDGWKEWI